MGPATVSHGGRDFWPGSRVVSATVRRQTVRYPAISDDEAAVEGYLQRCAFDDTVTLGDMLAAPGLGDYLRGCVDDGTWTFEQEVALLWFDQR